MARLSTFLSQTLLHLQLSAVAEADLDHVEVAVVSVLEATSDQDSTR